MEKLFSHNSAQWLRLVLFAFLWVQGRTGQAQVATCAGTDPGGQPATAGLYAEYFRGYFADEPGFFTDNQRPAGLRRVETSVNFAGASSFSDLLAVADGTAQDPDNFSLRLRGSLLITTPGTYTFYLTADDGAYLWLDGEALALPPNPATALIDNGGGHPVQERSASITLAAGRHNVLILYGEACCDNTLIWEYAGPGLGRQVVPAAALCTAPVASALPPQALAYATEQVALAPGSARTSGVPTVQNGGAGVTGFALGNAAELPAGIQIDATTGVLTAGPSLAPGTYNVAVAVSNANGTSTFRNAFRFVVTPPLPSGCGGLSPSGEPTVAGLYAEYFAGYFADDTEYVVGATPGVTRVETSVNFEQSDSFGNLTALASGPRQNPDEFTARLRGSLYLATAGTYTFYLTADDAAYLWLDNAALASPLRPDEATINNGGYHGPVTVAATVQLSAGLHNLALLYGENAGDNSLVLEYENVALGIARQVVPGGLFCTSLQPALPVATGLSYAAGALRLTVGSAGSSSLPTVLSAVPVLEYRLSNAAELPAGISLDAATGRVTVAAGVPEGYYPLDIVTRTLGGNVAFTRALTVQIVAARPLGCLGLDNAGTAASSGLFVEYFPGYFNDNLAFFTATAATRTNRTQALDFASSASWNNALNLPTDEEPGNFSARFRGQILVPATGTYTLHLTSDDAAYLWLDNAALATPDVATALINNGGSHPATTQSATVLLSAGLHNVLVLYGEDAGPNVLRLEYESADAGVTRQLVSASSLCTTTSLAPLPVVLTRFGARSEPAGVVVRWATAQELNSAAFVVERSANGKMFEAAGRVAAAGTTSRAQQYTFTDARPLPGLSYYRLRQLDQDGTEHLSAVVSVRWEGPVPAAQLVLVPNPSPDGACTIQLQQPRAQAADLQILDATGRAVYRQRLAAAAASEHTLRPGLLPAGVYVVRVTSATGVLTQRLHIQ